MKTSKDSNGNWAGSYKGIDFVLYKLKEGWSWSIRYYSPIFEEEQLYNSSEDYPATKTKKEALVNIKEAIEEKNKSNSDFMDKRADKKKLSNGGGVVDKKAKVIILKEGDKYFDKAYDMPDGHLGSWGTPRLGLIENGKIIGAVYIDDDEGETPVDDLFEYKWDIFIKASKRGKKGKSYATLLLNAMFKDYVKNFSDETRQMRAQVVNKKLASILGDKFNNDCTEYDGEEAYCYMTRDEAKELTKDINDPRIELKNGGGLGDNIDLFEHYDKQPDKLSAITDKWSEKYADGEIDYKDTEKFLKEVEAIGYTFDYGLDNEPYNLRKIGTQGNPELMRNGGKVKKGSSDDITKTITKKVGAGKSTKKNTLTPKPKKLSDGGSTKGWFKGSLSFLNW